MALEFAMAGPSDLEKQVEEFSTLHQLRWGALEGKVSSFYEHAAAELLTAGLLRLCLCLLRIDGKSAAAIYAFQTGQTLYCYLSGSDPALAKLSPGAVLLGWLID